MVEPLEFWENSSKTYTPLIVSQERQGTKQNHFARSLYTYRGRFLQRGLTARWLGSKKEASKKLQEFSNFWSCHPFHSPINNFPTELNRSKTTWGFIKDILKDKPTKFDPIWTRNSRVTSETLKFC